MHKPQGGQSQSICQPLQMHPEPFLRHHLLNLLLELQILLHHRYHLKVQHCSFWLIVCLFSSKFVPYRNFRKAGFFMLFSFRDALFRGNIQRFYSSVWLNKSWHDERIAGNMIFGYLKLYSCVACDFLTHTWSLPMDYWRFLLGPAHPRQIWMSRNMNRFVNILTLLHIFFQFDHFCS